MTSFIITGKNDDELMEKALALCLDKTIDQFDITVVTSDKDSLGIETIKKMQEKVFLMPLRGKDKAIIIPTAELLTIPAQNALLKLLEEPPEHTYIFLLTISTDDLLSTIKSRCQIIKVVEQHTMIPSEDLAELIQDYKTWINQDIGNSLKMAEKLAKDKDAAIIHLQSLLRACRKEMLDQIKTGSITGSIPEHIRVIQSTINTLLRTNASTRLVLENLLLNLSR